MFVEVKDPEDKVESAPPSPAPPPRFALGRQIKQALVLPLMVPDVLNWLKKKKTTTTVGTVGRTCVSSSQTLGCFSASCFFQFVTDLSVTPAKSVAFPELFF